MSVHSSRLTKNLIMTRYDCDDHVTDVITEVDCDKDGIPVVKTPKGYRYEKDEEGFPKLKKK